MDAFEKIIGGLFERRGYWVRYGFKVELTKKEKRRIGLPSVPRWELDIAAYKPLSNELLVIECKSYLDSPGVRYPAIAGSAHRRSDRCKLFNNSLLRSVVLKRLLKQLEASGSCPRNARITMCLAAGKVVSEYERNKLKQHFARRRWLFFDEERIRQALKDVSASGYENDVTSVVAKLLLRPTVPMR